jgi:hypothetical protein
VQHDIGRHAALARHFRTPRPERADQRWISGFTLAGGLFDPGKQAESEFAAKINLQAASECR